jgi:protein TonB
MRTWALFSTVLFGATALAQPDSIRFSSGSSYPAVISKVKPEYTEQAKKAGIEGEAVLAVTVDENGLPKDPEFVRFQNGPRQIPDPLGLDEMAVKALTLWRFKPAMKDGKPISLRVKVVVLFDLPKPPKLDFEQH